MANAPDLQAEIEKHLRAYSADPTSRAFAPLAEAYRKAGKIEEALKVVQDGLARHPGMPPGLVTLGRIFIAQGRFADAKGPLEKAVKLSPENLAALTALGSVQEKLDDPAGAVKTYRTVLLLNPADADARARLAALQDAVVNSSASEKGRAEGFEVKSAAEAMPRPVAPPPAGAPPRPAGAAPAPGAPRPPAPVPGPGAPRPPGAPVLAGAAPRPAGPPGAPAAGAPRVLPTGPPGAPRPAGPPGIPGAPAAARPPMPPAAPSAPRPPMPGVPAGARPPVPGATPVAPRPAGPLPAGARPPVPGASPAGPAPPMPGARAPVPGAQPRPAGPPPAGARPPMPAAAPGAPPRPAGIPPAPGSIPAGPRPLAPGAAPAAGAPRSAPNPGVVPAPRSPISAAPGSVPARGPAPAPRPAAAPVPAAEAPRPAPAPSIAASSGAIPTGNLDDEERTPVPDAAPASIQTVTMADLFVQQGHAAKAVPIYEGLLAEDPANASLREKLIAARRAASPAPDAGIVPESAPRVDDETTEPPIGAAPTSWDTVPDFDATDAAAASAATLGAPPAPQAAPATAIAAPKAPEAQLDPAPPAAAFAFDSEPAAGPDAEPEPGLSAEDPRWSMGSSAAGFDVTATTQPDADVAALASSPLSSSSSSSAERLRASLDKIRSRRRAPPSAPALAGKEP